MVLDEVGGRRHRSPIPGSLNVLDSFSRFYPMPSQVPSRIPAHTIPIEASLFSLFLACAKKAVVAARVNVFEAFTPSPGSCCTIVDRIPGMFNERVDNRSIYRDQESSKLFLKVHIFRLHSLFFFLRLSIVSKC